MNGQVLQRLIQSKHVPAIGDSTAQFVKGHVRTLVDRLLYVRKKITERRASSSVNERKIDYELAEAEALAWSLRVVTDPDLVAYAYEAAIVPDEPCCPSCGQTL